VPFHVPPVSRRQFLSSSLAAGVSLLTLRWSHADTAEVDPNSWALLADTHLAGNRAEVKNGVNMADNFEQVAAEIRALAKRPAGALVNGDCALLDGKLEDYQLFAQLVGTLTGADIPVHLGLGNHDHRENFWQGLSNAKATAPPVDSKHVTLIESPSANWFVLDTLDKVNVTPGKLGEDQLRWLAGALDDRPDKPAIVFAHHNLDPMNPKTGALTDTDALYEVMIPRRQVKAYVFGHTHHWEHKQHEGIHLVNLPPVAYPFNKDDPNGWVHCQLNDKGATFELRALNDQHPKQGQKLELTWRS
jgi:3',5'-cyclic-AMP phosphodiesterase